MEAQVWKLVNRERKEKKIISADIKIEEWESYFTPLLKGGKIEDRTE